MIIFYAIMMAALVMVFFIMVVLPQKKREQFHKNMVENLKVGDKVVTSGGIVGIIDELEDDIMHVKVDENVVIPIIKRALFNIQPNEKVEAEDTLDGSK